MKKFIPLSKKTTSLSWAVDQHNIEYENIRILSCIFPQKLLLFQKLYGTETLIYIISSLKCQSPPPPNPLGEWRGERETTSFTPQGVETVDISDYIW